MNRHTFRTRRIVLALGFAATVATTGCVPLIFAGAVGGAAAVATDRRTSDTMFADERIELTAAARLKQLGEKQNTSVTSYNRVVLLTGQVADPQTRVNADRIVSEVPGVRYVVNETTTDTFRNFGQRSNDSVTTTQVKARLVAQSKVANPAHVKVVTDDGVVYLLGLVSREEGDEASQIASTTAGVKRVVRVFEYQSDEQLKPKS